MTQPAISPGDTFNLFDLVGKRAQGAAAVIDVWQARHGGSLAARVPNATWLPDSKLCRDLGVSTASAGGNLAGSAVLAVAEASRPPLLLESLGARRLEVAPDAVVALPVWVAGAAAGWLAEGATAPSNTSTVRQIAMTGKLAAARLLVSRKVQIGGRDVQPAVLTELANSVRATIEAGFLVGSGSDNEPLGITRTTGRTTVTFAAATPTFSELRSMLAGYLAADGDLGGAVWLMNPSDFTTLQQTQIVAGASDMMIQYQGGNWRALGAPAYPTRHLTAGQMLLFNPAETICAYWGAPQIVADDRTGGKSLQGAVEFILLNLCDVGVLHPARIVVGSA